MPNVVSRLLRDCAEWLRCLAQITTYLGIVMIVTIWVGVTYFSNAEYDNAYQSALRQGANLTRTFDEYVSQVVKATDSALLAIRELYERDAEHFDLASWVTKTRSQNSLVRQFSIAAPDGKITFRSLGQHHPTVDISDRDYFRKQASATADDLCITQPMIGRSSGKPIFQLVRRLRAPDGSFAGVVYASLDIEQIKNFYNSIDTNRKWLITLAGFDGIIRASNGFDSRATDPTGRSIEHTKVFELFRKDPVGSHWNSPDPQNRIDGVRRLVSYRVVEGVPLIAIVGMAENDVFGAAVSKSEQYHDIGFGLTAFVLAAMAIGASREKRLSVATAALESSNQSLQTTNRLLENINLRFDAALANMPHGLCMFDSEKKLIICNNLYATMYGLDPEATRPGTPLLTILEARVEAGASPKDAGTYILDRLRTASNAEPYYAEIAMRNGKVFAINHQPTTEGGWVAIHQDITAKRLADDVLRESQNEVMRKSSLLETAVGSISHGLCMFDGRQRLVICNRRYGEMYGLAPEYTTPGTPMRAILEARMAVGTSPKSSANYVKDRLELLRRPTTDTIVDVLSDGRVVSISRSPMPGGGFVSIHQDITAQKAAEAQIVYMARHDPLTGLANRTVLLEKAEEALARLGRGGDKFNIVMLDLDMFKEVNDTLGHSVGDKLLKAVAQRLATCTRDIDLIVRLGGDEFAILEIVIGDQEEAATKLANRLLETISASYDIEGHQVDIATSIGISFAPDHGANIDELMKRADLALYTAKSGGRNRHCFFETAMENAASIRRVLEIDMRNALIRDEFELHYLPIVDIKTRQVARVEALVRWRHPKRGLMAPDGFIALAEETGLINPLGEWVLRTACTEAANWPAHVKAAVNISPVQFRRGDLVDVVSSALDDAGLPPDRLGVEITESVLMQGNAENIATLHELQSLGISIILDDFGTGYSSLSYLRIFPFDKIKIDRSFVNDLSNNPHCAAIISAIAGLGMSLDIDTVAEGVETEEQLKLLRAAGCTHAQGFLFGSPCPASELAFGDLQAVEADDDRIFSAAR